MSISKLVHSLAPSPRPSRASTSISFLLRMKRLLPHAFEGHHIQNPDFLTETLPRSFNSDINEREVEEKGPALQEATSDRNADRAWGLGHHLRKQDQT